MTDKKELTAEEQLYLTKYTSAILNSKRLALMEEATIVRMPEAAFKQNLLPVVQRWINGISDINTELWMKLAGGFNRPIYVTDDHTGEEIFVVPPPYSDIPMMDPTEEEERRGGRQITGGSLLSQQESAENNKDVRMVARIDQQLMQFFSPGDATAVKTQHLLSLLIIWKRYNLDIKEILGERAEEIMTLLLQSGDGTTDGTQQQQSSTANEEDDEDGGGFVF